MWTHKERLKELQTWALVHYPSGDFVKYYGKGEDEVALPERKYVFVVFGISCLKK